MYSNQQEALGTGLSVENPTGSENMASIQGRSSVPGRADVLSIGLRGDIKARSQETCMGHQQSDRLIVAMKPVKVGGAKGSGH